AEVEGAPPIGDAITDTVERDPDVSGGGGCAKTVGADRVSTRGTTAGVGETCLTRSGCDGSAAFTAVRAGGHGEVDDRADTRDTVGGNGGGDGVCCADNVSRQGG